MADGKKDNSLGGMFTVLKKTSGEAVEAARLSTKLTGFLSNPLSAFTNPSGVAETAMDVAKNADNKLLQNGAKDKFEEVVMSGAGQLKAGLKGLPAGEELGSAVSSLADTAVKGVANVAKIMQENGLDKQLADLARTVSANGVQMDAGKLVAGMKVEGLAKKDKEATQKAADAIAAATGIKLA